MNIIFIGKRGGRTKTIKLGNRAVASLLLMVLGLVPGLFLGGYHLMQQDEGAQAEVLVGAWQKEMETQREEVATARQKVDEDMDALAMRLGALQAKVIRLDALGERLTEIADLDKGEFDFSTQPAVGGPENPKAVDSIAVPDFVQSLDSLSRQLDNRSEQLALLETMLMNRSLQEEVRPAGRPINRGWISSYYGMRTDPFTGRREFHKGMDFAGKEGSDVVAVGAGVVTWAGDRYGYGKLVEVNHGNGYATRYGHNKEVLVSVGDTVKKGQTLGHMGSTGRSTGPHVHLEVLYKGKPVDPKKYALASR
jgi:murein DD-endopeptidase MepM/ murein hydrolase activator NlpD